MSRRRRSMATLDMRGPPPNGSAQPARSHLLGSPNTRASCPRRYRPPYIHYQRAASPARLSRAGSPTTSRMACRRRGRRLTRAAVVSEGRHRHRQASAATRCRSASRRCRRSPRATPASRGSGPAPGCRRRQDSSMRRSVPAHGGCRGSWRDTLPSAPCQEAPLRPTLHAPPSPRGGRAQTARKQRRPLPRPRGPSPGWGRGPPPGSTPRRGAPRRRSKPWRAGSASARRAPPVAPRACRRSRRSVSRRRWRGTPRLEPALPRPSWPTRGPSWRPRPGARRGAPPRTRRRPPPTAPPGRARSRG
mmetsp:Transcript_51016/g.141205  ORF Transcript_51016/g.141205 Transcript_51016/m.141205 type:complete len:304 (+) Transcript_51016:319-1230(+)